MTRVLTNDTGIRIVIIEPEPEAECELCHQVNELRPYGPNGERICCSCAQKDPAMTERRMAQHLFGEKFDA